MTLNSTSHPSTVARTLTSLLFKNANPQYDPLAHIDLTPLPNSPSTWKPIYYHPHMSTFSFISDKYLSLLAPIAIYWIVSLWFTVLDVLRIPFFEKYRLHEPEEITKRNKVSATKVVWMVLVQQAVQTILGIFVLEDEETVRRQVFQDHTANMTTVGVWLARVVCGTIGYERGLNLLSVYGTQAVQWLYWWIIPVAQFWLAFFLMDTWQYALHRAFHESRFLYRHFHSHHHRLYVPYAFGALYNHPFEGLLLDSAGTALAHALALMTVRQGVVLFTFSTLKTVCDHGGYAFPWWLDPLHLVFPNCAEYHDVHHQMQGLRYNYSQPYFVHFDILFGTRMGSDKFHKIREANRKWKQDSGIKSIRDEHLSAKTTTKTKTPAAAAAAASTTSIAAAAQEGADTRTTRRRQPKSDDDAPPAQIAAKEKDPLVTTDLRSYRAKAGVAAS